MARPTKPKELKPKAEGEAGPAAAGGAPGGASGSALDIKFLILLAIMVLSSILGSAGSVYLMTSMFITPEIHKLAKADGGEGEHGSEAHASEDTGNQVGMNLELDEFMVNLKPDPALGGSQYLRAKMALSIKAPDAENCYKPHAEAIPSQFAPVTLAAGFPPTLTLPLQGGGDTLTQIPSIEGTSFLSPPPRRGRVRVGGISPLSGTLSNAGLNGGTIAGAALPVDADLLANSGGEGGPPPCEGLFKASMGRYVPTIRDVVNASLMKRTASQLASQEGQETLKDEIKEQLSQIMAPNYEVLRVNFQDFIIQR
jgi:flagellar basal body-associated protein FliL